MKIALTAQAEADLQALYDQRSFQRGASGPDGADALLDQIYDAIAGLTEFPLRGPIPPKLDALGIPDWHQRSAPRYRIIYTVAQDQVFVAVIA